MMQITGTHFNYYIVCQRKLWLFANGMNMEHTSDLVYEGKLLHENSYPQRAEQLEEVELNGIKIDYYDHKNKIIHEIKKSDKVDKAHEWQLKYYLYRFEKNGIENVSGILEYPALRKKETLCLTDEDRKRIREMETEINNICQSSSSPSLSKMSICKNCSYFEFCYSSEPDLD